MAKMTLGEMVDDILNDMDSDPVTTYTDTEESRQVAQIIIQTYFQIIDSREEWPHLLEFFKLTATGGSTPTQMTLPSSITKIKYIKYNTGTSTPKTYNLVKYLEPQAFMNVLDARDSGDANVTEYADSVASIGLNIITDAAPSYWTMFGEDRVVFDSYNASVDASGLVAAKTQCYGMNYPTVTPSDSFIFSLPLNLYRYLLNDAKSTAFIVLKQANDPKADFFSNQYRVAGLDTAWKHRKNYVLRDNGVALIGQAAQQPRGQDNG
jgi:hypothetical protein